MTNSAQYHDSMRDCQNSLDGKRHYCSLQILRGMAALSVVLLHVSNMLQQYTDCHGLFCRYASVWHIGGAGVDLFFIISGFVMVQSTRYRFGLKGSSREFMLRRLIRIVPLYWLYTSLMLVLVLLPFTLKEQTFSVIYTLKSYFFVPAANPASGLDLPLLAQGWTLSYEMYFYLIFAVLLRFHEKCLLPAISALFLLSVMVGMWQQPQGPLLRVLTSPLLLEFVLGCYLARLVDTRNISTPVCALLIVGSLAALIFSPELENHVELRLITWGVPTFFLAAGCVFLEKNGIGSVPGRRFLTMLGDSSYSTYLTHTFVVLCFSTMLKRKLILPAVHNDLLVAVSITACLLVGYISYWYFEKEFSRSLLKICFKGDRPSALSKGC